MELLVVNRKFIKQGVALLLVCCALKPWCFMLLCICNNVILSSSGVVPDIKVLDLQEVVVTSAEVELLGPVQQSGMAIPVHHHTVQCLPDQLHEL